jgi:PEGA domain-containing protein
MRERESAPFFFPPIIARFAGQAHNSEFPGPFPEPFSGVQQEVLMREALCMCLFILAWSAVKPIAQEAAKVPDTAGRARVFITDSQSWEVSGGAGGSAAGFGGASHGGARPQTAEIIKTFGERCPEVIVNNIQEKTDYIVLLDHEGGKSILQHRNKVAVFARVSGDSVVSKSTMSLGGSVQEACAAIHKDWSAHGAAITAAAAAAVSKAPVTQPAAPSAPAAASTGKLSIVSIPDGADIEVDGSFVGNAPSDLQVAEGDHTIAVKKAGFKNWERKMKVSGGSSVHLNAELEKSAGQ